MVRNPDLNSRRSGRVAIVGITIALALTGVPTNSIASAATPTDGTGGRLPAATSWLASRFTSAGTIESIAAPGTVDYDATTQAAFAITRSPLATSDQRSIAAAATTFLLANADAYVKKSGVDLPGRLAKLIRLAYAVDPVAAAGTGSGSATALVNRLIATQVTTGADTGMFGAADPYGTAFGQAIALQALVAAGQRNDAGATWLRNQQCPDGSWVGYRSDLAGCSFDPATFVGPDTNSTAVADLALRTYAAKWSVAGPTHDTRPWFDSVRSSKGGWSFNGGAATSADPDSTAAVLADLIETGRAEETTSSMTVLLGFQFDCTAATTSRGAAWYPPFGEGDPLEPNVSSTVAMVEAMTAGDRGGEPLVLDSQPAADFTCATTTTTTVTTTTTTAPASSTTVVSPTTVRTGVESAAMSRGATAVKAAADFAG